MENLDFVIFSLIEIIISKIILLLFIYLNKFIYLFLAALGLRCCTRTLVAVSGGYSLLWCVGFSLRWPLLLQSTGSKHAAFSSCGTWAQ